MKIQPIIPQQNNIDNKNKKNVNFNGAFDAFTMGLRFLETNQAWGANAVDLCAMVIPRTTVDFVNRGPDAGIETARREAMGTFNHSMVGVYGTVAAALLASSFNKQYGIKAQKLTADDNMIDILSKYWLEAKNTSDNPETYVKAYTDRVAENIKFFNPDKEKTEGFIKLSKEAKEKFSSALADKLLNSESPIIDKDLRSYLYNIATADTGAEAKVVLEGFSQSADSSLKVTAENIYNVSKTFMKNSNFDDTFVKGLKSLNLKRSIAGLGIGTVIGMSTQPINMYLTKKKTGSDGFVGVPGREKDNSNSFKLLKTSVASLFALGALSTITTDPKKFLSKLQFKGMTPTISQLKFVYGLTIASRFLSARDKDELRESAVKDTLGFFNLLVLGALVTKGVARGLDKSLINTTKESSKNFFKWLTNSSLKTRDEVLYSALKEKGIATIKDGKALPFKELIKHADKATKAKLWKLNIAQITGYLYSGLILGVGIPKLNIYMTNKSEAKRKARLVAEQSKQPPSTNDQYKAMIKPENMAFLSKNM